MDMFSLVLLYLLYQGETALAGQLGIGGSLVEQLHFTNTPQGFQLIGIACLRLAFFVALVVVAVDTFTRIVRLLKNVLFNP